MVFLGNFGVKSKSQQLSNITYDTFNSISALTSLNRTVTSSGQKVNRIFQIFDLPNFNWSEYYIRTRFKRAEEYKNYTDYLVFLMTEEIYTLTETNRLWSWIKPSSANGNAYTIEGVTIPKMPDAGESNYLLALLKAWHTLCKRLNKKTAILGSPSGCDPNPEYAYKQAYTSSGLTYIKNNYDMVYIYKYPSTGKANTFGCRAKEPLDYWRKTLGYTGKINYILDTYFNPGGSSDYNTIKIDFKNATDNGADIISCYPYVNIKNEKTDISATARMIKIYNELYPNQCNPVSCNFTIN